ncbi:MAG: VIT1/CCC1 transporter family protein [Nanoarchaeota archaeon]
MLKRGVRREYLSEFVYGGIDGAVTTFAVVSGAMGASLTSTVILILGFANLFADGFSMAVSNYLSTSSQRELNLRHKHAHPHEEKSPKRTAIATFISFLAIGIIPLISFVLSPVSQTINSNKFVLSFVLTGIALLIVGAVKGKVIGKHYLKSSFETLAIGGVAALIAFLVGYLLKGLAG